MSCKGYAYPPAEEAVIASLPETSYAARLADTGERIRVAHGRYWLRHHGGFCDTVHWLARLTLEEARAPGLCWGYRALLVDDDADHANGTLPIHLMRDLDGYSEARLRKDARRHLKRLSGSGIRIVNVTDDRAFADQGYEIMLDWRQRTAVPEDLPTREQYLAALNDVIADDSSLVLAAMDGERLLGYVVATVVEGSAYLLESKLRTDALKAGVGILIDHRSILAFQRSGVVREVTAGLHQPELPSLTTYKIRFGFPVVHLPARVRLPGVVRLVAKRRPLAYYRLTGRLPDGNVPPAADWSYDRG